jgi:hypothetical protein
MTQRSERIDLFLAAMDGLLQPLGFTRRIRSQEWRSADDPLNVRWVHLNFGLGLVNPSLGVSFSDVATFIPMYPKAVTMRMLSSLVTPSRLYSLDAEPSVIVDDVRSWGLPELDRLADRESVISALRSEAAEDWPAPSYSDRIRLLPLLMASGGRVAEALEVVRGFEVAARSMDQIRPSYDDFAAEFKKRFVT